MSYFSYNRVSPFLCEKRSFLISLIFGFVILGCVFASVPSATVYGAACMGLCCAAVYGVHTVYNRGWF